MKDLIAELRDEAWRAGFATGILVAIIVAAVCGGLWMVWR